MNLLKKIIETMQVSQMVLKDQNASQEAKHSAYYVQNYYTYVKLWSEIGGKTFILSKDLIEAFIHTDISLDMYPNDFQYPFDTFVVEGEAPLFTTNSFEGTGQDIRPIDTILYTNGAFITKAVEGSIIDFNGKHHDKLEWDHALNAFFPAIVGCSNIMLYMSNTQTIRDVANIKKGGFGMVPVTNEDNQKLCNIFFNTLLYVNDPSRNKAETQLMGTRKWKMSSGEKSRNDYIYLKPPKAYKPLYASSGRTLDVRFIVRGHWRNQAYGEGRKEHKRIWILPFWKGPEMSEIVSKPYSVG